MQLSRRFSSGLFVTVGLFATVAYAVQPAAMCGSESPKRSGRQAQELIKKNHWNPRFTVLDVRTPAELAAGHPAGSVNVDFRAPDFKGRASKLERSKRDLVYCST